jgi:hypothetical protein
MLRQVSSRNNRSKGLKVKSALQLFLLSAVTIWLLYQLKHSYDEKKTHDENKEKSGEELLSSIKDELSTTPGEELLSSIKDELSTTPGEELLRFGRKDLVDTETEQKNKKNRRKVTKISERDTNLDETYGDEEVAEMIEEAEAEENDEPEKGEIEKDETDADAEETTTLLEDEEIGKDEVREARERTFHQDNVASAVTHDVNMSSWHEDYLESKEKNLTNTRANNESRVLGFVIGNGLKNITYNGTGSLSGLKDNLVSVNLTNGIVITLNKTDTISSTTDLSLDVDEKGRNVNKTMVSGSSNSTNVVGTTGTGLSLNPVSTVDEREDDSHIKITGTDGADVVLE